MSRRSRGWFGLTLLAAWLGCTLDDRKPGVASPGDGPATSVGSLGAVSPGSQAGGDGDPLASGESEGDPNLPLLGGPALAQGTACQSNVECSTGNCVDGVCCDSPCTDLCASCNVPDSLGLCTATANDPLCPAVACQGQSTECRPLDNGQVGVNCQGVGVCRGNAQCTPLPAPQGTPCQQGAGMCDGQGACIVANKSALGATCAADSDCGEGHCVPGGQDGAKICCDAACDGVCQGCSAAGRCEVTPATDARCQPVTCPTDNVCRDYVPAITDNLCGAFGQCRTALDCGTTNYFMSLRPSAQCACDPTSGSCTLAVGTSCAQGGECASGQCLPTAQGSTVCCAGPCGAGLFCSSTGSGCVQCEGSQISCDGTNQRTCNAGAVVTTPCPNGCTPGTGCNAVPPVGFPCSGQCAAGAVCQQDTGGQSRCCVRNCAAEGKVCSPSGSCDCPQGQAASGSACLKQAGDPCQTTGQCQASLTCVDGVCCQEACNGYCEACEVGTGLCRAIPAGQQETDAVSGNSCSNGFECTGARNSCKARTGQSCTSTDGSSCVSGACQPTAGGGARVCCSQTCGAGTFCRSSGQGCVQCETAAQCGNGCNAAMGVCNPLKVLSASCARAAECASNSCVAATDGGMRCCPACQPGQQCTPQGACITPQSGPGGRCSVNSDCRQGVCSGGLCCNRSCDATCETCNGQGQCVSNGRCPVVQCGNAGSCFIANGNVCCVRNARPVGGSGGNLAFSCESNTTCDSVNDPNIRAISCDDPSDCNRRGDVCCHEFPASYAGTTHCLAQTTCNDSIAFNLTTFHQICQSPSLPTTSCNPGFFGTGSTTPQAGICSVADVIPGWSECDLDFSQFTSP